MKALVLALTLACLSCAGASSNSNSAPAPYPTLEVYNNSGSSVKVFLNHQGREYRIGSAWPGKSCFRLNLVSEGAFVSFGIRHIAEFNATWTPFDVPLSRDSGWFLEINQPSQAVFDLNGLLLTRGC